MAYTSSDEAETRGDSSQFWQVQLALADKEHKDWIDRGREIVARYKSEGKGLYRRKARKFNILYSNTEVQRRALYGRTAKPDVRRRFSDADPVARQAAEIIERGLIYCQESYDPDKPIERGLLDALLPGRGVLWIDYEPVIEDGKVTEQKLSERYIFWEDYRESPARQQCDVTWRAYRILMTREELIQEFGKEIGSEVPLNWVPDLGKDKHDVPDTLKKSEVWCIWDKDKRERVFVVKGFSTCLRVDDDPYGLEDFFPCPEPLVFYAGTDSTIPRAPFEVYADQADDLDEVVSRISKVTSAIRRRGVYDQSVPELKRLANAADNEFVPVQNYAALATKGGLAAAYQSEDISVLAQVLLQLYQSRDMLVNAIYEVTGIADIMRGSTDPNETLGAQQLKAQFGSQRVKGMQNQVQKWIRDALKIKAEIIAEHYEPEKLQMMTGIPVDQNIIQLLRSDKLRSYRIDIETDSTIFEESSQQKQDATEFTTAVGQFIQSWGPVVQEQPALMPLAMALLEKACRAFKYGRDIEDVIEQAKQQMQQAAQNPPPDPAQQELQMKQQEIQGKMQIEQQKAQIEIQEAQTQAQLEMVKAEMEKQKMAMEMQFKQLEMQMKEKELLLKGVEMNMRAEQAKQEHMLNKAKVIDMAQARQEMGRQFDETHRAGREDKFVENNIKAKEFTMNENQFALTHAAGREDSERNHAREDRKMEQEQKRNDAEHKLRKEEMKEKQRPRTITRNDGRTYEVK